MPIDVFAINIDQLTLKLEDVDIYQMDVEVICCTSVNDGVVMEKLINPFETTLRTMVLNILG